MSHNYELLDPEKYSDLSETQYEQLIFISQGNHQGV